MDKIHAPEFIQGIDWAEFKEQRQTIIDLSNSGDLRDVDKHHLNGLISLCDSIVDYAIDEMGLPEKDVLLTKED